MPTLPKTIGACIDLLVAARRERKRREQTVEEAKSEESRIEEHILRSFEKQKINGARGKLGSATLKEKDVPHIVDYEALCAHIKKTGAWDLLQQRPGERACQARWEVGEEVPGVEKFHKLDLTLTEVK